MKNSPVCEVCKFEEAIFAWQPFGPDEKGVFTLLGSHYRGFPVIKICPSCKEEAQKGRPMEFSYKAQNYTGNQEAVYLVPTYIGDPLAYWVEIAGGNSVAPVKRPYV